MRTCINLRELYGDRFQIAFDPAYQADLGRGVHRHDPWLMLLPCCGGRGEIGPWSETELVAYLDKPRLANKLIKLGGRLHNRGDRDATVVFPVVLFDAVAKIMRPRVRRRLSPDQKAKYAERLQQSRAKRTKPTTVPNGRKVPSDSLPRVRGGKAKAASNEPPA